MALESPVTYISDLVSTNPTVSDPRNEGDDHIRNVKAAVKATFPNITGAVTATHTELNLIDGLTATAAELNILDGATLTTTELNYVDGVTSAIQTQLDAKAPLASPTFTGTLTAAALTATGNVTLGDAGGDTVTTNGNVTINAPSSGVALTVNGSASGNVANFTAANSIVGSTGTAGFGAFYATGSGTNSAFVFFGNAGGERGRVTVSNDDSITFSNTTSTTTRVTIGGSGNVTINAPSSGGHTITGALNFGVAGTEWDVDASNRLINPGNTQPKFRATRVTSSQTSGTTLIFNSVAAGVNGNHGSAYNTSDGVFTAPVDGYYFFSASVPIVNTSGSTVNRWIDLYAVGVAIATSTTVSITNGGTGQLNVSGGCFMAASQTAYVAIGGGALSTDVVLGAATYSSFSGHLFC